MDDVSPKDLLFGDNYTTKDIRDARFAICKTCPELFRPTATCKRCSCFMAMKTWLKNAHCPIHLWGVANEAD